MRHNEALIICAAATLLVILAILYTATLPKVHAQERVEYRSDRDQERQYCAEAMAGMAVQGATRKQLADHCKKYL